MTITEKTIDLTPTWVGVMPGIIAALRDGSETGQKIAREELMVLAAQVDLVNLRLKNVVVLLEAVVACKTQITPEVEAVVQQVIAKLRGQE